MPTAEPLQSVPMFPKLAALDIASLANHGYSVQQAVAVCKKIFGFEEFFIVVRIFLHQCQLLCITVVIMNSDNGNHIPRFEPWEKYPDLTEERLSIVADIIRRVRHESVLAHEETKGDTNWGLGCRVYERTCFALRTEAPLYPEWFSILQEFKALQFSFAIGSIPFRFYRGTPNEPPDRYTICSFGELHHQQYCLALEGLRPPDNALRLAVETSPVTLEVIAISVVEVDTAGNPINVYQIPATQRLAPVVPITQAKPVELAPPQVEPLDKIEKVAEEVKKEEEAQNAEQQAKAPKTDTGSK